MVCLEQLPRKGTQDTDTSITYACSASQNPLVSPIVVEEKWH